MASSRSTRRRESWNTLILSVALQMERDHPARLAESIAEDFRAADFRDMIGD
jgi:hypothetical protein